MRVTQQTVQRSTLSNLQLNLSRMADLQGRMSGGKVITKPSDDPPGTAQALSLRQDQRASQQYQRNAQDAVAWLTTVDTALQSSVSSLREARDLTVRAGGLMDPASRNAIAQQIEGVRDALIAQSNTQYLGRSVFAGTSGTAEAFDPTTYTWNGNPAGSVERRLSADLTVRADTDGSAAFGDGATSVFALLDTIAAEVRAGTNVGPRLTDIDTRMQTMLGELAGVGTRQNQVTTAQSNGELHLQDVKSRLSGIEDIDLAKTIVELQMQEVAYQGALGATQRVLQPTLMDFLR